MTLRYKEGVAGAPWFKTAQEACSNRAAEYNASAAAAAEPFFPGAVGVMSGDICYLMAPQGGFYTFLSIYSEPAPMGFFGGGGGSDGGADGGDGSPPPSSYGGGAGGAGAGGGLGVAVDGASGETSGAGLNGSDVLRGANLYPSTLPCPRSIVTTPGERRLMSDIAGKRQFRALARDYSARERIEWPPLTEQQALIFKLWWRETLNRGGSWFATSDWPSPQGGTVHRRFVGPPKWAYLHAGANKRMWSVSAECEASGRRV